MLNFILTLFSKKRKIAQISENIATSLNTSFYTIKRSNGGEIFSLFKEDRFILGYIIGACHAASHILGLSKPEDKGTVIFQVQEYLFQENRKYISDYTLSLSASNNDDNYKRGLEAGLTDYSLYINMAMDKSADAQSLNPLKHLDDYLNQYYSSLINDSDTDDDTDFLDSLLDTVQLRNSIEHIYKKYQLPQISDSVTNKLEAEVLEIAKLIAKESVKRSGRALSQLNDDESFTAMLFCFIASDYLTNRAELNFEVLSTVTLTSLLKDMNQAENTSLIAEVINNYNSMIASPNDSKVIIAAGSQVSKFFASNEDSYLDSLGELFELMVELLKPEAA